MFNKTTKQPIGNIELTIKDSDPYTKMNMVRFQRIDTEIPSSFEMFLSDEELVKLRDMISNHVKEIA